MDKLIYTSLSGARSAMERQAVAAANLANVSTEGYRAEIAAFGFSPVGDAGAGASARVFSSGGAVGADLTPGAITHTGRELDVAIQGSGWIAVRARDGSEAYTRAGSLQVGPQGVLATPSGHPVLSAAGPIGVPPDRALTISEDGTISQREPGGAGQVRTVGRIKLVDPPPGELVRGEDGLFRMRNGAGAQAAENVRLVSGAVEGSNVKPAEAMVTMIEIARQFEMQMKMLQSAEANARSTQQLLTLG